MWKPDSSVGGNGYATIRLSRELNLQPAQLERQGTHPADLVTVRQLLATWTAHDMAHVTQIGRTLAKRFKQEVGPWAQFLSVMK